jgi:hypothetical protein
MPLEHSVLVFCRPDEVLNKPVGGKPACKSPVGKPDDVGKYDVVGKYNDTLPRV